jgi:hypothetical protein
MVLVFWLCSLIGASCGALPDFTAIQSAYEREAAAGNSLHDSGLKVLNARCHRTDSSGPGEQALCEVTFTSRDDPTERLYFDIVAVARAGDGWTLRSGLCKR